MSVLDHIKKGVANSGSNKGKIVYFRDGSKKRIRFLADMEDGIEVTIHDSYSQGINTLCQQHLGKDCPYDDEDNKDIRTRQAYVWPAWDYDSKEVKLFVGFANNFNPLPSLAGMYEAYGTLTDRDYVITRTGSGTNTKYSVVPMDKVRFKNTKAKPYSQKKTIDILSKAYPLDEDADDDDDFEEEDEKETRKKVNSKTKRNHHEEEDEDDDDDEEENEYEDMKPRELYMECKERGLKAKPKKSKQYYIDLLEEDDEKNKDGWDDEDNEDEEEDW